MVSLTSDDKGDLAYAYQLDGNYRPNYKAELKDSTGTVVASTSFTDTPAVTIINVSELLPDWSTGVFSAYVGPPSYGYVSPGSTALYDGREAGIIKALCYQVIHTRSLVGLHKQKKTPVDQSGNNSLTLIMVTAGVSVKLVEATVSPVSSFNSA